MIILKQPSGVQITSATSPGLLVGQPITSLALISTGSK